MGDAGFLPSPPLSGLPETCLLLARHRLPSPLRGGIEGGGRKVEALHFI